MAFKSLKDPDWEPPADANKSKTSFGTGAAIQDTTPAPVHMPIELRRTMEQRVQKASLPEGERISSAGWIDFLPISREDRRYSFARVDLRTAPPEKPA